jgi:hypothetical protein
VVVTASFVVLLPPQPVIGMQAHSTTRMKAQPEPRRMESPLRSQLARADFPPRRRFRLPVFSESTARYAVSPARIAPIEKQLFGPLNIPESWQKSSSVVQADPHS